ncbi:hypothetical protein L21_1117 [Methanoculleus chikugoensis]|uniref:Uncharacterized protein n=1 Tax=Methanoculleus chikugoensis TaxID=118126 RepID=A0A1M4MJY3_9EURY|nr:hypothetical protein [Methanoculleus chikugoensis]SCL75225.1 hypothetical protein L21_1117 [Methanoculleus chikugoensis]
MTKKQDFTYVVLGIVVVLVLALIVKPAATGEPTALWGAGEPEPAITPAWTPTMPPATAAPTPTPVPTWDGKPRPLGFVDPTTYQIPAGESSPNMTAFPPETASGVTRWVTYATIDGQWSGTTGIVRVPFPIWRLDYSDIATSNDEIPLFNCQVMDAEDPNRFVRVFTLNFADFLAVKDKPDLKKQQWVSTFYEGYHDYYFVVNTRCIDSYHLKIQVPETYIGT